MASKEALKFQEALAKKIKSWEGTEDFAKGSTNRQKINRSLNLLLGSDPEIIIDMLGGDFVPDKPREAMNLIRNLDLKTLKQMEILPLKGLGNKLVGHHGIAASTMQALRGMKPTERLKVYKGLSEMGQRFGMDPKQIFLIADKIHKSVAHGNDFGGIKTGVTLPYIAGETGDEFLRRFEEPVQKQLGMLEDAIKHNDTQKYYQAINVVEERLGIPKGVLIDPNTPLELKGAATKLLEPIANPIRDVVNLGDDIPGGVKQILNDTSFNPKALQNFQKIVVNNGIVRLNAVDPVAAAMDPLMKNRIGAGAGVLFEGYNIDTIQKLEKGNIAGAGTDIATGAVVGAGIEAGAKVVGAEKLLGRVAAPIAGASLLMEGREGSTTDYLLKTHGKKIGMNQNRPSWGTEFGEMNTKKPREVEAVENLLDFAGGAVQTIWNRLNQERANTGKNEQNRESALSVGFPKGGGM